MVEFTLPANSKVQKGITYAENNGETEFLQAVEEVAEAIIPFIQKKKQVCCEAETDCHDSSKRIDKSQSTRNRRCFWGTRSHYRFTWL